MKAKPFIKWVGGKGQLIEQLEAMLPADFDNWENVTYIEPFVDGGAILFYILQTHITCLLNSEKTRNLQTKNILQTKYLHISLKSCNFAVQNKINYERDSFSKHYIYG